MGFKERQSILIAGPCSAESREQVLSTAESLSKDERIDFFRAGVWKPRTRPGSFEGVGEDALDWLIEAEGKYKLPSIVEVANTKHVEKVMHKGISAVWIGARTSVNPFLVEEISQALEGFEGHVFLKNPINPDLNLWIGGLERIMNKGIKKVGAIHRGFSSYNHKKYRNEPLWEIPLKLKQHFKNEIQLINDPSHIAGKLDLLGEVTQKALDLNFDGLMIETHPSPMSALSDKEQQIPTSNLSYFLDQFIHRKPSVPGLKNELETVREEIDQVDKALLDLLKQRMDASLKIGELKKELAITIYQEKRWESIKTNLIQEAQEMGLSLEFITKYLDVIHQESIHQQNLIMNKKG